MKRYGKLPPLWPPSYDDLQSKKLRPTPSLEPVEQLTPEQLAEAKLLYEYEQQTQALRAKRGY